MSVRERRSLIVDHTLHADPSIAAWLWALHDARRRTNEVLEDIPAEAVDWLPPQSQQSIGTILYHMALIEADWLYAEVLEQDYPTHIVTLFPYDDRDEAGLLTQIQGVALAEHRSRLATVRNEILRVYDAMDAQEFSRVRQLADYDVTPAWVLHHLTQHEAEHRSEIVALRNSAANQRP